MPIETPRFASHDFVNLFYIIENKKPYMFPCLFDLKSIPGLSQRVESPNNWLCVQNSCRQKFCCNGILKSCSIFLYRQFTSLPFVKRQIVPLIRKTIHSLYQCFPNPIEKNPTSPTGNSVTLGDTKPYKKGQSLLQSKGRELETSFLEFEKLLKNNHKLSVYTKLYMVVSYVVSGRKISILFFLISHYQKRYSFLKISIHIPEQSCIFPIE